MTVDQGFLGECMSKINSESEQISENYSQFDGVYHASEIIKIIASIGVHTYYAFRDQKDEEEIKLAKAVIEISDLLTLDQKISIAAAAHSAKVQQANLSAIAQIQAAFGQAKVELDNKDN